MRDRKWIFHHKHKLLYSTLSIISYLNEIRNRCRKIHGQRNRMFWKSTHWWCCRTSGWYTCCLSRSLVSWRVGPSRLLSPRLLPWCLIAGDLLLHRIWWTKAQPGIRGRLPPKERNTVIMILEKKLHWDVLFIYCDMNRI